jgi:hypothetical protein
MYGLVHRLIVLAMLLMLCVWSNPIPSVTQVAVVTAAMAVAVWAAVMAACEKQ